MERHVGVLQNGHAGADELGHDHFDGFVEQVRVDPPQGVLKTALQDHAVVAVPFCLSGTRCDVGPVGKVVAQVLEPLNGGVFDDGFGEAGQGLLLPRPFAAVGAVLFGLSEVSRRDSATTRSKSDV